MSRPQLVCATANPNKVAEIRAILGAAVELLPRPAAVPDIVEDATSLIGNARLKAQAICAATGLAAVADDTGLEVDALDGAPGVHSARYAGPGSSDTANRDKLLGALDGVSNRRARFRTAVVVSYPDGHEIAVDGVCEGVIATAERGTGGFGYDRIFVPDAGPNDQADKTFAQMSTADKHAISHRGRAFRALLAELR